MKFRIASLSYLCCCLLNDSLAIEDILGKSKLKEEPSGWPSLPSQAEFLAYHPPGATPWTTSNPDRPSSSSGAHFGQKPIIDPAASPYQPVQHPTLQSTSFDTQLGQHSGAQAHIGTQNQIHVENLSKFHIDESTIDQWLEHLQAFIGTQPTPQLSGTKRPAPIEYSSSLPPATRPRLSTEQDQLFINHRHPISNPFPSGQNQRDKTGQIIKESNQFIDSLQALVGIYPPPNPHSTAHELSGTIERPAPTREYQPASRIQLQTELDQSSLNHRHSVPSRGNRRDNNGRIFDQNMETRAQKSRRPRSDIGKPRKAKTVEAAPARKPAVPTSLLSSVPSEREPIIENSEQLIASLRALDGSHPSSLPRSTPQLSGTKRAVPTEYQANRLATEHDRLPIHHRDPLLNPVGSAENAGRDQNGLMVEKLDHQIETRKTRRPRSDIGKRRKVRILGAAPPPPEPSVSRPENPGTSATVPPPAHSSLIRNLPSPDTLIEHLLNLAQTDPHTIRHDIPKLTFTKAILTDHTAVNGNYKRQVSIIHHIFDKYNKDGQLIIPEDKIYENVKLFSGRPRETEQSQSSRKSERTRNGVVMTSYQRTLDNNAERYALSVNRRHLIWNCRRIWYEYWKCKAGLDFEKIVSNLIPNSGEMLEIFPMYLFYVEMISTIIPRTYTSTGTGSMKEEMNLRDELLEATSSFMNLLRSSSTDDQSATTLPGIYNALRSQIHTSSSCSSYFKLWAFLNYWIHTHRFALLSNLVDEELKLFRFQLHQISPHVPPSFKTMFNNLFYASIRNLNLVYKPLIDHHP
ncbi:hypothetical protein PSTG_03187 [Puccinia striiformis f. sp. tritici PST-78]|uniref:Uncharacterized protein n=1 Tax=Puccinia striiformis f. sp. tritici PST-78 TaxID=1165861 RepID=A0A0L0VWU4_9BASI|nr:hypothetical protein PSTG_03187 [Puccinia striiformis f. sp. tritici PST-78]